MISWIQRTFQHHFRILFGILLVITIISFVFIYNPSSGISNGDRRAVPRPFFGINLNNALESGRVMNDAALSVNLQVGYMGFDNSQLQEYGLQRVVALHIADQYHLGSPDAAEFTEFLKTLRAFAGADGKFDTLAYRGFRSSLKAGTSITEAEIARVISDDWRIDQVQKMLGGPGYVLDKEIREQLVRADSKWTLGVATADYTAFDPGVTPAEADLTKFFQDNIFRYEIPPQVRTTYIEFPLLDSMDRVSMTDAEVRAYYDRNPGRFPKPATPAPAEGALKLDLPATSDPAADFAAVESQVRAILRTERARNLATKQASDLALALYNGKVTRDKLDAFLTERKLTRKPLAPFSQGAGPVELGASLEVAREGFRLNAERFYSDAVSTQGGGVVLFWEESLGVRQPVFAEVRERVTADYRESEKRKKFEELGRTLRAGIETRMKSGTSFVDAANTAAAEAGLKVEAKALDPFTLREPPIDTASPVLSTLEKLEKGQISEMVISAGKGYIVHAADKQAPDLLPTSPTYIAAKESLASQMSRFNANSLLTEMVTEELAKTDPAKTP